MKTPNNNHKYNPDSSPYPKLFYGNTDASVAYKW